MGRDVEVADGSLFNHNFVGGPRGFLDGGTVEDAAFRVIRLRKEGRRRSREKRRSGWLVRSDGKTRGGFTTGFKALCERTILHCERNCYNRKDEFD